MRKLSTGEPCAGEPLARFGGRGGSGKALLYPYSAMDCNLPIPLRHYLRLGFVSGDCGSNGQAALRGFARGTGRGRPMFEKLAAKRTKRPAFRESLPSGCRPPHCNPANPVLCKDKRGLRHSKTFQSDKVAYLSIISSNCFARYSKIQPPRF